MYYYIVDCGSTGSRIFEFKKSNKSIKQHKVFEFGPIIFLIEFYSIPHKLQKETLSNKVQKLFKLNLCMFINLIKKQLRKPCKLYFGLTGGVRKFIIENKHNKNVMNSFDLFYDCLKSNSNKQCQITFDKYTMTSGKECYLEYLSCLYLSTMFQDKKPTGVIGLGGASIQISYDNGSSCIKVPFSENIGYDQVADKLLYSEKQIEQLVEKKFKKIFKKRKLKGIFYGTEAFYYTLMHFNLHNKTYTIPHLYKIITQHKKTNDNKLKMNLILIQKLLEICFDQSSLIIIKIDFGIKNNKLTTSWVFGKFVELIKS
tara:strand:+ start:974 stop:1915 length:942 start_codon:yes stop_codon:yes gene_type:complete